MSPEEVIVSLKGQFFLSPRERQFINLITKELQVPEDILRQALEECLKAVPPEKRRKFPLFKCLRKVLELQKLHARQEAFQNSLNWKEVFYEKLSYANAYLNEEIKEPQTEEEAERILRELESKLMKKLWEELSKEERKKIVSKYKTVKEEDEELFKELIKHELRKIYKIPELSLYVR